MSPTCLCEDDDGAKFKADTSDNGHSPWQVHPGNECCYRVLRASCRFRPEIFENVMLNLIKNPNVTSSHLFRADIFYDSLNDVHYDPSADLVSPYIAHMKKEYQPLPCRIHTFHLKRTLVRQLVPRNPQRDATLIQTCHILYRQPLGAPDAQCETIVVYLPHAPSAAAIPYYHPPVKAVLFQHSSLGKGDDGIGFSLGLHMVYFETDRGASTINSERIHRTSLNLLRTIWKHGQGELEGYVKRVQHDTVIPQKRVQDTYTRLKGKYAKGLLADWRETTDPTKHVFEDLGIAAFLIELWKEMYTGVSFPGFVDIGCGNGVLVHLLIHEGYIGWGFDARRRKSWEAYPKNVQESLKEMILVPNVFQDEHCPDGHEDLERKDECTKRSTLGDSSGSNIERCQVHNGLFPKGTFVISNHADELTPWTPLLAYLSSCPFICIPCCSHDLSGARFRAPPKEQSQKVGSTNIKTLSSESSPGGTVSSTAAALDSTRPELEEAKNPKTGSLAVDKSKPKQPSAYASLCGYVRYLSREVGFSPEKEMLRIPSTRNEAIIGRKEQDSKDEGPDYAERRDVVCGIVERELCQSIQSVGRLWRERAQTLASKSGSAGH